MASTTTEPLLRIENLTAGFARPDGHVLRAVDGISLEVHKGKTLGLVGESGCGKSVTAFSILRLLPHPAGRILNGSIRFGDLDLAALDPAAMTKIRGNRISIIFQEPMTALNPVHRIGRQLIETIHLHRKVPRNEAIREAVDMLKRVGIPAAEERFHEYPHQLSGGMRQRVMIAMALINQPEILIADEPTTALDVTVQAQILELMAELQRDTGMGMILITHDLGVVAETCDEVAVMYAGRVVERAPVETIFARPLHPYTQGLLRSMPHLNSQRKHLLPVIPGNVPSLDEMPPGCRFASRCDREVPPGVELQRPPFIEIAPDHWIEACPCFAAEVRAMNADIS
jgi:oligopeptide/dipeptide ABC transporter ATP-binding protein